MAQPSLVGQGAGRAWRQQTATSFSSWYLLRKSTRRMRIRPWFLSHSGGIRCGSNTNSLTLGCDYTGERERKKTGGAVVWTLPSIHPAFMLTEPPCTHFYCLFDSAPVHAISEQSLNTVLHAGQLPGKKVVWRWVRQWPRPEETVCDFYCWGLTATKVAVVLRPGCPTWIMGAL